MNRGHSERHFRIGHTLAVFGFFLALTTLIFQGSAPRRTVAFGASEVASLSNNYRVNSNLTPLTLNSTLTVSAQAKADHMAAGNYFAHDAPDGTSPWFFFDQAGYSYLTAGENLALTNQDASAVVDGWYNSPGHRANMLSADFTEVGYGISFVPSFTYEGSTYNNVYLVAAHYAKPYSTPTEVQPAVPAQPSSPPPQEVTSVENAHNTPQTQETEPIVQPTNPAHPPSEQPLEDSTVAPSAPQGFDIEPENTMRSGTYEDIEETPPHISQPLTYAGLGTGGIFVGIGSTIELRKLLRHEKIFSRIKK